MKRKKHESKDGWKETVKIEEKGNISKEKGNEFAVYFPDNSL